MGEAATCKEVSTIGVMLTYVISPILIFSLIISPSLAAVGRVPRPPLAVRLALRHGGDY